MSAVAFVGLLGVVRVILERLRKQSVDFEKERRCRPRICHNYQRSSESGWCRPRVSPRAVGVFLAVVDVVLDLRQIMYRLARCSAVVSVRGLCVVAHGGHGRLPVTRHFLGL